MLLECKARFEHRTNQSNSAIRLMYTTINRLPLLKFAKVISLSIRHITIYRRAESLNIQVKYMISSWWEGNLNIQVKYMINSWWEGSLNIQVKYMISSWWEGNLNMTLNVFFQSPYLEKHQFHCATWSDIRFSEYFPLHYLICIHLYWDYLEWDNDTKQEAKYDS